MKKNECELYIACIKDTDAEQLLTDFGKTLEVSRLERIDKCRNKEARKTLICAGVLLSEVLSQKGLEVSLIEYSELDKPYIKGSKNLFFNMSHSGDYVAIALSGQEIGVDVQKPSAYNENVVRKISSEEERIKYERMCVTDFGYLWAIKESFSKLKGDGILMDFSKITFDEADGSITYYTDGKICGYGVKADVADGYSLVVCGKERLSICKKISVIM